MDGPVVKSCTAANGSKSERLKAGHPSANSGPPSTVADPGSECRTPRDSPQKASSKHPHPLQPSIRVRDTDVRLHPSPLHASMLATCQWVPMSAYAPIGIAIHSFASTRSLAQVPERYVLATLLGNSPIPRNRRSQPRPSPVLSSFLHLYVGSAHTPSALRSLFHNLSICTCVHALWLLYYALPLLPNRCPGTDSHN